MSVTTYKVNPQKAFDRPVFPYHENIVIAIREKILGKEHPSTATTYNNIALVYSRQGDYAKALQWYQKALDICERVLGHDHPTTIIVRENIDAIPN